MVVWVSIFLNRKTNHQNIYQYVFPPYFLEGLSSFFLFFWLPGLLRGHVFSFPTALRLASSSPASSAMALLFASGVFRLKRRHGWVNLGIISIFFKGIKMTELKTTSIINYDFLVYLTSLDVEKKLPSNHL